MNIPEYDYNAKTVTRPELEEMGNYIVKHDVKRILEFGSGISSHFFGTLAEVLSLEDQPVWRLSTELLKEKFGPSSFKTMAWSGREDIPDEAKTKWDMVFVDGPVESGYGKYGRTGAFQAARYLVDMGCPSVWMHDAWEHHCIDQAVRHLAPVCLQKAYPRWERPNKFFSGASMLLWERA